jgi:hypothetical protein
MISKHNWGTGLHQCGYSMHLGNLQDPNTVYVELSQDGRPLSDGGSPIWAFSQTMELALPGRWNHIASYWSRGNVTVCINGDCAASTGNYTGTIYPSTADFMLFANLRGTDILNELIRPMDEVRVSRVSRGQYWVRLSYENQREGSTFITIE